MDCFLHEGIKVGIYKIRVGSTWDIYTPFIASFRGTLKNIIGLDSRQG